MTSIVNMKEHFQGMDGRAVLIRKHIPIVDVSLIIEDYGAEPVHGWSHHICVVCQGHNTRRLSCICKECARICLHCKEMRCSSDKKYFCGLCAFKYPVMEWDATRKGILFQMWHRAIFPSDVHHDKIAHIKKMALQKAEEKKKEDLFLATEAAKPLLQQVLELRNKLWEANKAINTYKETHYAPHLVARPQFPYY